MVHPYLRRRQGRGAGRVPDAGTASVLEKTLGVPLFQEQAMKVAIVAAGFTPSEADQLRRAWRLQVDRRHRASSSDKMIEGMVANGYHRDFAERCFNQIEGFGDYGFPESHAASFALLVYASAWMKCHHPDVFAAAMLNTQPMGFYAPAQLVRDAREHGVTVRAPDVQPVDWDCTLEPAGRAPEVSGFAGGAAADQGFPAGGGRRIVAARLDAPSGTLMMSGAGGWSASSLELLAQADAWRSLGLDRRAALWAVQALGPEPLPLFARIDGAVVDEPEVALPDMALGEHVVEDIASLSLSLKCHPLTLLREGLEQSRILPTSRTGRGAPRYEDVRRRPRPGPATAGKRQRRGLHHAGGRIRRRQPDRRSARVRAVSQGDSNRPANRRNRAGRASGRSDPPAGRSPDRPESPCAN